MKQPPRWLIPSKFQTARPKMPPNDTLLNMPCLSPVSWGSFFFVPFFPDAIGCHDSFDHWMVRPPRPEVPWGGVFTPLAPTPSSCARSSRHSDGTAGGEDAIGPRVCIGLERAAYQSQI